MFSEYKLEQVCFSTVGLPSDNFIITDNATTKLMRFLVGGPLELLELTSASRWCTFETKYLSVKKPFLVQLHFVSQLILSSILGQNAV